MAPAIHDTFTGSAADLTTHVGEVGATWTRHPSSVETAFHNNLWYLSGTGTAYSNQDTYANAPDNNNHALYIASGTPAAADYDIYLDITFLTAHRSDTYQGVQFDGHATANTGWRLIYSSYSAVRQWQLQMVVDGVATTLYTLGDDVPMGDARSLKITRRTSGGNTVVNVYLDGSSTAGLMATDSTATGGNRIGLFATGSGYSTTTDGIHYGPLAVAPGETPPDDELTGAETGPPARLTYWESQIGHVHFSGGMSYNNGLAPNLGAAEHYEVILCMMQARDYCNLHGVGPQDWTAEIQRAVDQYRGYVLDHANPLPNSTVPPYHVNTGGLARHWYETGDPEDRVALELVWANSPEAPHAPYNATTYRQIYRHMGVMRENAYRLIASIDEEWAGMGEGPLTDAAAGCALEHISQILAGPAVYWGIWNKPWMTALALKALIFYWDRYRGSVESTRASQVAAIPAAVKSMCTHIRTNCWYPAGTPADDLAGLVWVHGCVGYMYPAASAPTLTDLTGLVIATVADNTHFTGPSSLSTVDGYYKYASLHYDDIPEAWQIVDYVGSTRGFTLSTLSGNPTLRTPGQVFRLHSPEVEADVWEQPSSPLNHMISPAMAWCYWHQKRVLGDAAGAAVYRSMHDDLFDGGYQSWNPAYTQKTWNQSLLWSTHGLEWRERGDAEWPNATTFTLEAPATGAAGPAAVESGPFRAELPHGVKLDTPATLNASSSSGVGAFGLDTPLLRLTADRPWAPFTLTPDVADDGTTIGISATSSGLTAPAAVPYDVGEVVAPPAGTELLPLVYLPAGGVLLLYRGAP